MELLGKYLDPDGTMKFVLKDDVGIIEITTIKKNTSRTTICIPSMYFCNLGCKFCHLSNMETTKAGAPIPATRIMEALTYMQLDYSKKNFLFSVMGVGDPLLNLNLIRDLYSITQDSSNSYGFPTDKVKVGFALSTMFPVESREVYKLVEEEIPVKLYYSMHSPEDSVRQALIPKTATTNFWALKTLFDYRFLALDSEKLEEHFKSFHKSDSPVEIHYTLIEGVNDSDKEIALLDDIIGQFQIPVKFIDFNDNNLLTRSSRTETIVNYLTNKHSKDLVTFYTPPGRSIGSSCGQFTRHFYHDSLTEEMLAEKKAYDQNYKID